MSPVFCENNTQSHSLHTVCFRLVVVAQYSQYPGTDARVTAADPAFLRANEKQSLSGKEYRGLSNHEDTLYWKPPPPKKNSNCSVC